MRRLVALVFLAICLFTTMTRTKAGDVPFPGAVPSPTPCVENCPISSTTTETAYTMSDLVTELVLFAVTFR